MTRKSRTMLKAGMATAAIMLLVGSGFGSYARSNGTDAIALKSVIKDDAGKTRCGWMPGPGENATWGCI
jgi:hypothetical protein